MSFRRNNQKQVDEAVRAHAEWRKQNVDLIEQTGLPSYCFTGENWAELLEYGSLVLESVGIENLTIRQKASLLRLIAQCPRDLTSFAAHLLTMALLDAIETVYPE